MKFVLFLVIMLSLNFSVKAQKIEILRNALAFYKNADYVSAMKEYEKLSSTKNGKLVMGVDGNLNLASCYLVAGRANKALELLSEYKDFSRERTDFHFNYGKALFATGQYDAAIIELKKSASLASDNKESLLLISKINAVKSIVPQFDGFQINKQKTPSAILTSSSPMGDAITINYTNNNNEQINQVFGLDSTGQLSLSNSKKLSFSQLTETIESISFDRSGEQAVVSVLDSNNRSTLLYLTKSNDDSWTVSPFSFSDSIYEYRDPSLSADGNTLYFSSNRKNGLGGYDIWSSTKLDEEWSSPLNVGKDVNTSEDERWPYCHVSNELFFASNGHPGFGNLDVFSVKPLGNGTSWSKALNLGQPLNSSFDDLSIHLSDDGTRGFFLSNRTDTLSLYQFSIPGRAPQRTSPDLGPVMISGLSQTFTKTASNEIGDDSSDIDSTSTQENQEISQSPEKTSSEEINLIIKFHVVNGYGQAIEKANLQLTNKFTGEELDFTSDDKGLIEVKLDVDQKFNINVSKEGYQSTRLPVSTMGATKTQTVVSDLVLKKIN